MSRTIVRYAGAAAFLAAAGPLLLRREALNSLILGVALAQSRRVQPHRRRPALYLTVDDETGPVLAALSTAGVRLLLAEDSDPDEAAPAALAAKLLASPRLVPSVFAEASLSRRFADGWSAASGQPATAGEQQRLLALTAVNIPGRLPGEQLRPATEGEVELLSGWLQAFQTSTAHHDAADLETARLIVDGLVARQDLHVWAIGDAPGQPVAMATRSRPTPHGIAISHVYTPPAARGHGYATACVAHLSRALLESGRQFCTLFVNVDNAAADAIYRRLGYQPLAEFIEYRLSL